MPARARGIRDIRTSLSARTVEPRAKPRLWVFVQRPGFSRVSERLGVEPFAEPGTDLLHEEQELVVLADLQGARAADVAVTVRGDILIIEARPGAPERRYFRKVRLPFAAAASFTQMFNNGVLEIQLRREAREP
jgi:HSP20 family molecular chaperone IbpA